MDHQKEEKIGEQEEPHQQISFLQAQEQQKL